MSVHALSAVVKRSSAASSSQMLLMMVMADMCDEESTCYPSRGYLAKACRCEPRTITRLVAQLEAVGELEVLSQATANGRQTTNLYRLTPGGLPATALGGQIDQVDAGVQGGVDAHVQGTTLNRSSKEPNPQEDDSSPASGRSRPFAGSRPKEADLRGPSAQAQRRAARKSGERPKPSGATQAPRYEKPKSQADKNRELLYGN